MSISSVTPATDVPSWTASHSPAEWEEWKSPEVPQRPDSQDPRMSIRSTTPENALPSTSRAPCPGCRRLMPVTKAGVIWVHVPVSKHCNGSGRPPSLDRLFRFCYRCLRVPKRGGHIRSLAGEVNLLLRDEADPPPSTQSGNQHPRPVPLSP